MNDRNLFEAGSWAAQGGFARAIACFKLTGENGRILRFMLVNLDCIHSDETEAAVNSQTDLKDAHARITATGNDKAMAEHLSGLGYCKLEHD